MSNSNSQPSNSANKEPGSADGKEAWGKLISFNGLADNVMLYKDSYSIGRNSTNDIKIPDIKLSGVHCKIYKDEGGCWIEDLSSNGTFADNELIGKGKKRKITSGDKLYLLHSSKVKPNEIIGYVFSALQVENSELKRKREEELKQIEEEKKKSEKQVKFQEELGEEMMCSVCIDYIYHCVTAIPCLHNFCAACFSDWMQKSTLCPQCREEVVEVKKNPTVNNIISKFMENNPSKKRPQQEYEEMDKKNKIKEDRLVLKNKPPEKKDIQTNINNRVLQISLAQTVTQAVTGTVPNRNTQYGTAYQYSNPVPPVTTVTTARGGRGGRRGRARGSRASRSSGYGGYGGYGGYRRPYYDDGSEDEYSEEELSDYDSQEEDSDYSD